MFDNAMIYKPMIRDKTANVRTEVFALRVFCERITYISFTRSGGKNAREMQTCIHNWLSTQWQVRY